VADEFRPGGDAEFGEHFAQVIFDGPGTEEEPCCDLLVRASVGDQPRDLQLLRSQLRQRAGVALARGCSGRAEFRAGPLGPGSGMQRLEAGECGSKQVTCFGAPTLAPQELSVQQLSPRSLERVAQFGVQVERRLVLVLRLGRLIRKKSATSCGKGL